MHANISLDELCYCIERLKHGKSPGSDDILADVLNDGGDLVQESLLRLYK